MHNTYYYRNSPHSTQQYRERGPHPNSVTSMNWSSTCENRTDRSDRYWHQMAEDKAVTQLYRHAKLQASRSVASHFTRVDHSSIHISTPVSR